MSFAFIDRQDKWAKAAACGVLSVSHSGYYAWSGRQSSDRPSPRQKRHQQLIEQVGLRRQRLFAAQPEVAERLLGLSRLAELATAWTRREPNGSTRGFVRYLSAVAEAGVEPEEAEEPPAPGAVRGMAAGAVKGLGFDHVFALARKTGAAVTFIEDGALLADLGGVGAFLRYQI